MPPPEDSARDAGLRYVSDEQPGIRRKRRGRGFSYFDANGKIIRDKKMHDRVKKLVIPPAWEEVWICPSERGHLQATGVDERGRKQYLYHERWREVRDRHKFDHIVAFGMALPKIRRITSRLLRRKKLPREKVLAAVVRLLEKTGIRVGNEEYAQENNSYGLTTMRNRHVDVHGSEIEFRFRGKSGKFQEITLRDPRLAKIVDRLQELPGEHLFEYLDDDGEVRSVDSGEVNEFLQEISGEAFTAKDFRTWNGTVLASMALQELEKFDSQAAAKRNVVAAVKKVARVLGNTPAVCRQCYIHPAIINAYLDGSLAETLRQRAEREIAGGAEHLTSQEAAVLGMLQQKLQRSRDHIK